MASDNRHSHRLPRRPFHRLVSGTLSLLRRRDVLRMSLLLRLLRLMLWILLQQLAKQKQGLRAASAAYPSTPTIRAVPIRSSAHVRIPATTTASLRTLRHGSKERGLQRRRPARHAFLEQLPYHTHTRYGNGQTKRPAIGAHAAQIYAAVAVHQWRFGYDGWSSATSGLLLRRRPAVHVIRRHLCRIRSCPHPAATTADRIYPRFFAVV